jgi:hypothetical protein
MEANPMKEVVQVTLVVCVVLLCGMQRMNAQWVQTNAPLNYQPTTFTVSGTTIYAAFWYYGEYLSTNNGADWDRISSGITNLSIQCSAVLGTDIFLGTRDGGVFRSSNNGGSWTSVASGLAAPNVHAIAVRGANLFLGTRNGVLRSGDYGSTWTQVDSGLTTRSVLSFVVSGTNIFAGTEGGGVFLSTNNGADWKAVNQGLTNMTVTVLAVCGTDIFAGTPTGVCRSGDNGSTWIQANDGLTDIKILAFAVHETSIFTGTYRDGVFLSTEHGTRWSTVNAGLTDPSIGFPLAVSGSFLFAGSPYAVWRRPLSEMTSTEDDIRNMPSGFALHRNYPNPFSSTTTLSFTIPYGAFVSLKIFDASGKEVTTIVSEKLIAGRHSRQWNAAGLGRGVYLCRLQAGSRTASRKISLIR